MHRAADTADPDEDDRWETWGIAARWDSTHGWHDPGINGTLADMSDGAPISMSEFTLGPRYGAEDMYRDMGIERPEFPPCRLGRFDVSD